LPEKPSLPLPGMTRSWKLGGAGLTIEMPCMDEKEKSAAYVKPAAA
jgi:hypothetical protein